MGKRKKITKNDYFEATIKSKDLIKLDIIQKQEKIVKQPETFEDVQRKVGGFNFENFIENELRKPKSVALPPYGPTKSLLVKRHHQEEIFVIGEIEYRLPMKGEEINKKKQKKEIKTTHIKVEGKDIVNVSMNLPRIEEENNTYQSPTLDGSTAKQLIEKHETKKKEREDKPLKMKDYCQVLMARRFCDTHMVNEYDVDKKPGYFSNKYNEETCQCPLMEDMKSKKKNAVERVQERYATNFEYRYHMQHINQPQQLQHLHQKEHYDPIGIKWYGNKSQRAGVKRGFPELEAQLGEIQDHDDCPCCRWNLHLDGKRLRPKNFVKEIALDVDDFATLRLKWSQEQFNYFIVALIEQQYAISQSMFEDSPLIFHTSQRSSTMNQLRVHIGYDLKSFQHQFTLDTPPIQRVFFQKQGFRFDIDIEHGSFDFVQYDHRKRDQFIETDGEYEGEDGGEEE